MNDEIRLGQLVSGQLLQTGIALAVARGVWHWKAGQTVQSKKIWTTEDIIIELRDRNTIMISDPDGILNVAGCPIGNTSRRLVQRGDYTQAVLILAAQAIDIMRQVATNEQQ